MNESFNVNSGSEMAGRTSFLVHLCQVSQDRPRHFRNVLQNHKRTMMQESRKGDSGVGCTKGCGDERESA